MPSLESSSQVGGASDVHLETPQAKQPATCALAGWLILAGARLLSKFNPASFSRLAVSSTQWLTRTFSLCYNLENYPGTFKIVESTVGDVFKCGSSAARRRPGRCARRARCARKSMLYIKADKKGALMRSTNDLLGRAVFDRWADLPRDMKELLFEAAIAHNPDARDVWLLSLTSPIPEQRIRQHRRELPSQGLSSHDPKDRKKNFRSMGRSGMRGAHPCDDLCTSRLHQFNSSLQLRSFSTRRHRRTKSAKVGTLNAGMMRAARQSD